MGPLDQEFTASLATPSYTRNFFGLTNRYVSSDNRDYYRLLQARYEARYGLSYAFWSSRGRVGGQLLAQVIITDPSANRFVVVSPDVTPDALNTRLFGGARLFIETNTYDDLVLPTQGVALHASVEARHDLGIERQLSMTYKGAAAVAVPFDRERRFVLLSRASVEGIVGPHPFYLAPTLGGTNLRAYRYNQFAGDLAFAHTSDLRIDVFRFISGIPGALGINLSVDHGRVFGVSTGDKLYHFNYGGGLWWSILEVVGLSLSYHRSLEGAYRVILTVGPLFSQTGF